MVTNAKKSRPSVSKKSVSSSSNNSGRSRDKVAKVTRVAIKTYEKAMKELAKH